MWKELPRTICFLKLVAEAVVAAVVAAGITSLAVPGGFGELIVAGSRTRRPERPLSSTLALDVSSRSAKQWQN